MVNIFRFEPEHVLKFQCLKNGKKIAREDFN